MQPKWSNKTDSEIDGNYADPTYWPLITGTSNNFKIFVRDCDAHKNNTSNFDDAVLKINH